MTCLISFAVARCFDLVYTLVSGYYSMGGPLASAVMQLRMNESLQVIEVITSSNKRGGEEKPLRLIRHHYIKDHRL